MAGGDMSVEIAGERSAQYPQQSDECSFIEQVDDSDDDDSDMSFETFANEQNMSPEKATGDDTSDSQKGKGLEDSVVHDGGSYRLDLLLGSPLNTSTSDSVPQPEDLQCKFDAGLSCPDFDESLDSKENLPAYSLDKKAALCALRIGKPKSARSSVLTDKFLSTVIEGEEFDTSSSDRSSLKSLASESTSSEPEPHHHGIHIFASPTVQLESSIGCLLQESLPRQKYLKVEQGRESMGLTMELEDDLAMLIHTHAPDANCTTFKDKLKEEPPLNSFAELQVPSFYQERSFTIELEPDLSSLLSAAPRANISAGLSANTKESATMDGSQMDQCTTQLELHSASLRNELPNFCTDGPIDEILDPNSRLESSVNQQRSFTMELEPGLSFLLVSSPSQKKMSTYSAPSPTGHDDSTASILQHSFTAELEVNLASLVGSSPVSQNPTATNPSAYKRICCDATIQLEDDLLSLIQDKLQERPPLTKKSFRSVESNDTLEGCMPAQLEEAASYVLAADASVPKQNSPRKRQSHSISASGSMEMEQSIIEVRLKNVHSLSSWKDSAEARSSSSGVFEVTSPLKGKARAGSSGTELSYSPSSSAGSHRDDRLSWPEDLHDGVQSSEELMKIDKLEISECQNAEQLPRSSIGSDLVYSEPSSAGSHTHNDQLSWPEEVEDNARKAQTPALLKKLRNLEKQDRCSYPQVDTPEVPSVLASSAVHDGRFQSQQHPLSQNATQIEAPPVVPTITPEQVVLCVKELVQRSLVLNKFKKPQALLQSIIPSQSDRTSNGIMQTIMQDVTEVFLQLAQIDFEPAFPEEELKRLAREVCQQPQAVAMLLKNEDCISVELREFLSQVHADVSSQLSLHNKKLLAAVKDRFQQLAATLEDHDSVVRTALAQATMTSSAADVMIGAMEVKMKEHDLQQKVEANKVAIQQEEWEMRNIEAEITALKTQQTQLLAQRAERKEAYARQYLDSALKYYEATQLSLGTEIKHLKHQEKLLTKLRLWEPLELFSDRIRILFRHREHSSCELLFHIIGKTVKSWELKLIPVQRKGVAGVFRQNFSLGQKAIKIFDLFMGEGGFFAEGGVCHRILNKATACCHIPNTILQVECWVGRMHALVDTVLLLEKNHGIGMDLSCPGSKSPGKVFGLSLLKHGQSQQASHCAYLSTVISSIKNRIKLQLVFEINLSCVTWTLHDVNTIMGKGNGQEHDYLTEVQALGCHSLTDVVDQVLQIINK